MEQIKNNVNFDIYQINSDKYEDEVRPIIFMPLDYITEKYGGVNPKFYKKVFTGFSLEPVDFENEKGILPFLESLFCVFNVKRPADFFGRSMSVSDVVVVKNGEKQSAWFVDDIGFKNVSNMFLQEEREE